MKLEISKLVKIGQNVFTTSTGQKSSKDDDYDKMSA